MLGKLLQRIRNPFESPKVPITGGTIDKALDGTPGNTAGQVITESSALTSSPIWAAIDLISSKIAELPWEWQRSQGKSWLAADTHPAFWVISHWANEMTAQQLLATTSTNLLLYGNAFAWIMRDGTGRCVGMRVIHPNRVQMYRRGQRTVAGPRGSLFYIVNPIAGGGSIRGPLDADVPIRIEQRDMFHVRHLSPHGHWGLSPIRWQARSIGRNMSTEDYQAEFFVNDATPGGIFAPDAVMEEDEHQQLLEQIEGRHGGVGRHHRLHVSRVPGKWHAMGVNPENNQLTGLLDYGVRDAARIYRVPVLYLQDPTAQSYGSNVEEGRRLLRVTLDPWLVALEAEGTAKLPAVLERRNYRTRFDRQIYTRGETSASDYRQLVEGGIMTRNEVRERMNLNPVAGGDELVSAMHVEPLGGESDDGTAGSDQTGAVDADADDQRSFPNSNGFKLPSPSRITAARIVGPAGE